MPKNLYEEGFPDDDPTDELPILTDVIVEQDDDRTDGHQRLTAEEDTGRNQRPEPEQTPTLEDRDETATGLVRDIADRDAKLAALEAELVRLEDRWRQTSEELTDARSELEALHAERRADQAALSQARNQVRERDQQIAALAAELDAAQAETEATDDTLEASPSVPQTEYALPQLICLTSDTPETYALDDGEVVIGRGSRCEIRLMTHYVSREHARLATIDGVCTLEDLGSRNGVFVNSMRVERQALNDDDLITIGDTQFRFRAAEPRT